MDTQSAPPTSRTPIRPQGQILPTIPATYSSVGHRPDGKYVEFDAVPHLAHIELTYACNAKCIFCYNPDREKLGDLHVIDQIVERVAEAEIPHVYLIGGEPSLFAVARLNAYIERLAPYSSVTIVTNGLCRLEGISPKLACFGVPLHGSNAETHEFLNQTPGSFDKTLATIRYYVSQGFDVRCIPVLTCYNTSQMYEIIRLAAEMGMESIFVDRYEDGGIGARNSGQVCLKPTNQQFMQAVRDIARAKRNFSIFKGRVGFGTAIPYCLDDLMITEQLTANCGVGTSFCAINPRGEFRLCNQSQLMFGNVLAESIDIIWQKPELDIFRDLSWVAEPCASCELLLDCTGGCKVDTNCSHLFCIDYAVRGLTKPLNELLAKVRHCQPTLACPNDHRIWRPNRYSKLTTKYPQKFLVTRYQTVKLNPQALEMLQAILDESIVFEGALIERFSTKVEIENIRRFVSQLVQVGALDLIGAVDHD